MKPHLLRCVALLLLFWAAVIHFLVVLPPFEGSDEDKHFGYVTHLRQTGQLPNPRDSLRLPARQASGQAPLYYVLARLWSELAPAYTWDGTLPLNPYVNPVRPVVGWPDNANVFLFGPDQIPYNPPLVQALMWQRLLSPFMGMLAVTLVYASARALMIRTGALFAALSFAFNPVLIFMFSYVTNDAAAIVASAASTLCLVRLVRRPLTPRLLVISGVVIGVGALTKANALVFAPIGIVAVLLKNGGRTHGCAPTAFNRLTNLIPLVPPMLLIAAPWYGWNALQYGDPFGIQPHVRTFWALPTPRSIGEALRVTFDDDAYQIRSLWYGVASGVVMSTHSVLIAPVVVLSLAVMGYVRRWRALIRRYGLILLTLSLIIIVTFTAYVRWLMMFESVTGRLLLTSYPALVLLVTLGLASLRISRGVRLVCGAAIVFGAVIVTGHITLPWFYTMRTLSPDAVPSLNGEMAQFGDVLFMGYRIEPERLTQGSQPRVTMCWRSLREGGRLPVAEAFAFHIAGQDGTMYYGRDSLPGMGLYTYWQPGRAFCDRFTLEERQVPEAGHGYRVAIGLFDPVTLERIPEATGKTFIGWIGSPGAPLTDRPLFDFEGVYLLDYALSTEDDRLTVTALWGTGDWEPRALTAFIHVIDANGELVSQLDTPLGGDEYPSMLWGDFENTYMATYELALPPDAQTVLLGLYDSQTLVRLAVVDAQGVAQADSVARLER